MMTFNRVSIGQLAIVVLFLSGTTIAETSKDVADKYTAATWKTNFFDDFESFNDRNWQDQMLWVNNEKQCYVPNNQHNTREVSNGTLKLRVIDLGTAVICSNMDKYGKQHPPTQYVAGRIASKNLKEFSRGKWTARLRVPNSGQAGMFPAWWLLGARNNEPPIQQDNEDICWPLKGSGEIDIFEHHSDGGANHYTSRVIKSLGQCDQGDWKSMMHVINADLGEYHNYSVEWSGNDLVYRLDDKEVYRNKGMGDELSEALFAILNFAKINDAPMTENWTMEVDWVKHEIISH